MSTPPLAQALFTTLRRSAFAQAGLFSLLLISGFLFFSSRSAEERTTPEYARAKMEKLGEEFHGGAKRREWFYQQRAYPLEIIPESARNQALEQLDAQEEALAQKRGRTAAQEPAWRALGPRPIANGQTFGLRNAVSGRVTTITLDPHYNGLTNQTVYVGAAQGGLWRSTDNGVNWTPLMDELPSLAVGAVAIDPNNPNVIFVGTGEPNRSGDSYYGAGLFKTIDGGRSWSQIVGPVSTAEPKLPIFLNCTFSKIELDPTNPNVIFAATNTGFFLSASASPGPAPVGNRGLWKTTDGGQTWINVNPTVSRLDRLASDVVIDPKNNKRVFAAITSEGIFRSDTGGDLFSWKLLAKGLPEKLDREGKLIFERIILTIGPPLGASTNSTIYAAYASVSDELLGIFRSTDNGENWQAVTIPQRPGQANYNLELTVDPTNANIIYYGTSANEPYNGGTMWRSSDGGKTWSDLSRGVVSTVARLNGGLHPDTHAIAVSAANPLIVFTGNDGGIWRTDNGRAGVVAWENLNHTLSITQFQSVAAHPYDPNLVIGGTQDNGTNRFNGSQVWDHIDDGDGGFSLIDQADPQVFYHTYFNVKNFGGGAVIGPVVSLDAGQTWIERGCFGCLNVQQGNFNPNDRVAFYAPMAQNTAFSGPNGNAVYFGTYRLYRTVDRGLTWTGTGPSIDGYGEDLTRGAGVVTAIAAFPSRGGVDRLGEIVWTGSSDGLVHVTNNAHEGSKARFFDVTRAPLPNRFITDIGLDPRNHQRAVVTFSGFNRATPNAPGHIFLTENYGASWTDISGDLPDTPVNSVVLDPLKTTTIYAGTDIGVFRTLDGGRSWLRLGNGMPRVSVLQLRYQAASGSLLAATHGRGVYRLMINPRTLATVSAASFSSSDLASEAIVSSFGTDLAPRTETARSLPLPTTLASARVLVRDSAGVERAAPLFFVSPTQANFQLPAGTALGQAAITITSDDGRVSTGLINVSRIVPGLFAANANGQGVPAGLVLRVQGNVQAPFEALAQRDGNQFVPLPIDVSDTSEQVFLVLYGTGFRFRSSLSTAAVRLSYTASNGTTASVPVAVTFAGAQGALIGLDQLNVRIPATMAGRGEVGLVFTVEGKTANVLRVNFK